MAAKRKALTRKITRKRALSYDRMAPNARGVTALSEINGPGAYRRRYQATRELIENGGRGMYTTKQRSAMKRMSPARRKAFKAMLDRAPSTSELRTNRGKKSRTKRRAAAATPNLRRGKTRRKAAKKAARPRTYGKGRFRALKGRIGPKRVRTYMYRTKRGKVRHIPEYAVLGYRSPKEMIRRSSTAKGAAAYVKREDRLKASRERSAERIGARVRAGRYPFTPNRGEVLSYEEWKMQANAKKRKKKTSKRRRKAGKKRGFAAMTKAKRREIAAKGGRAAGRKRKRRGVKRAGGRPAARRAPSRRRGGRKMSKTARRRLAIRHLKKACVKVRRMKSNRKGAFEANRRRRKRSYSSNRRRYGRARAGAMTRYVDNRRRKGGRRRYRRNVSGAAFKTELMNAFKYGLIVTGGYIVHRAATNLLDKHVLSKVEALSTGTIGEYRKLISGLVVALVGVPLTVRVLPTHAGVAAAGIAASLLHGLIVTALQKAEQPELLEAVSAYPDAPGRAWSGYGSYYEYSPHQVFNSGYGGDGGGYGEYFETQPTPGLEQAAAGFGAGLQQMYANPMGEYYAYGLEGVGEYETMPSAGPAMAEPYIDNGIMPNLHAAEQALNVAEAAAGFGNGPEMLTQAAAGFGDLPLQSTVEPMIRAMDIPDEPGGSRAGILAGGDGIFG